VVRVDPRPGLFHKLLGPQVYLVFQCQPGAGGRDALGDKALVSRSGGALSGRRMTARASRL
jgi:hypothetical protein